MSNKRKVIANGAIAKRLMHRGHLVIDSAPKRENPKESLFIFYVDSYFWKDYEEITTDSFDRRAMQRRYNDLKMTEKEYRQMIFSELLAEDGVFDAESEKIS